MMVVVVVVWDKMNMTDGGEAQSRPMGTAHRWLGRWQGQHTSLLAIPLRLAPPPPPRRTVESAVQSRQ